MSSISSTFNPTFLRSSPVKINKQINYVSVATEIIRISWQHDTPATTLLQTFIYTDVDVNNHMYVYMSHISTVPVLEFNQFKFLLCLPSLRTQSSFDCSQGRLFNFATTGEYTITIFDLHLPFFEMYSQILI